MVWFFLAILGVERAHFPVAHQSDTELGAALFEGAKESLGDLAQRCGRILGPGAQPGDFNSHANQITSRRLSFRAQREISFPPRR